MLGHGLRSFPNTNHCVAYHSSIIIMPDKACEAMILNRWLGVGPSFATLAQPGIVVLHHPHVACTARTVHLSVLNGCWDRPDGPVPCQNNNQMHKNIKSTKMKVKFPEFVLHVVNRDTDSREEHSAMVRAWRFADVAACGEVSNPTWCRIFTPLNLGTLFRCGVLWQGTLPSNASLDSMKMSTY